MTNRASSGWACLSPRSGGRKTAPRKTHLGRGGKRGHVTGARGEFSHYGGGSGGPDGLFVAFRYARRLLTERNSYANTFARRDLEELRRETFAGMADRGVDLASLPKEVKDQLAELELELSEGNDGYQSVPNASLGTAHAH